MDSSSPQNENEDKRDDDKFMDSKRSLRQVVPKLQTKENLSQLHLVINQRRRIKIQVESFGPLHKTEGE